MSAPPRKQKRLRKTPLLTKDSVKTIVVVRGVSR